MPRTASSGGPSGKPRKPTADLTGLQADFCSALDRTLSGPVDQIAVALSGGSDSTALLGLALGWAASRRTAVYALVVDHGLRPESHDEANAVADTARDAGARATVLRWTGPHPATGIQEAARDARYALMGQWCQDQNVADLLLGHQMEDQAATVLMRIRRGSGVDGLGGMAPMSDRNGIRIHRPMLGMRRNALRTWLGHQGIGWVEDPTNRADRFERNRLDSFLETEDRDGSLVENLALLARRQSEAAAALEEIARTQWISLRQAGPGGWRFPRAAYDAAPLEIRHRLLRLAMGEIAGHALRLSTVEKLHQTLNSTGKANAGGVLARMSDDLLIFTPEPARR